MVYGRYNELVHGAYFMVYKATWNWGGPLAVDIGANGAMVIRRNLEPLGTPKTIGKIAVVHSSKLTVRPCQKTD